MIKAIIWDMGDVLCSGSSPKSRQAWEHRLGLQAGEMGRIVFYHPIAPELLLGTSHPDEMFEAIGTELGLNETEWRQLGDDFWGSPNWNLGLFEYIWSIKGQYKLGVLSDAWITTREKVRERINYDLFDVIVYSAESGLCKPDPSSYSAILTQLELEAAEGIFVDDRLVNVDGARETGMKALQYSERIDIHVEIEQLIDES
jgi:FMN phosphatase YigB (HAD superfamily)